MTDNSKRIDVNGTTLFQLGYETLPADPTKVYAIKQGSNGKMSAQFVEAAAASDLTDYAKTTDLPDAAELMTGEATQVADLASDADLTTTVEKVNALLAALRTRGVIATAGE